MQESCGIFLAIRVRNLLRFLSELCFWHLCNEFTSKKNWQWESQLMCRHAEGSSWNWWYTITFHDGRRYTYLVRNFPVASTFQGFLFRYVDTVFKNLDTSTVLGWRFYSILTRTRIPCLSDHGNACLKSQNTCGFLRTRRHWSHESTTLPYNPASSFAMHFSKFMTFKTSCSSVRFFPFHRISAGTQLRGISCIRNTPLILVKAEATVRILHEACNGIDV